MKMKNEKKLKRLYDILNIFNIVMCFAAAVLGISQDNAFAACGWLCALLAYLELNQMIRRCNGWENIGGKFVDLFHSIFSQGGEIVGIEVRRLKKDLKEEEPKKDLPDFAPEAAESFHECAKEFFHYVEEGNREFSISHGGVTLSVSIPEDDKAHAEGV